METLAKATQKRQQETAELQIKPLMEDFEMDQYFNVRRKSRLAEIHTKNIAVEKSRHEIDSYDSYSFHFGAKMGNQIHACTRMVNDSAQINRQYPANLIDKSLKYINDHSAKGLTLQRLPFIEYVSPGDREEVTSYFASIRQNGSAFNEIGRLIRAVKSEEKYLMNYMICYAWAYNQFYNIPYCFFMACQSHSKHYIDYFNCERVLNHLNFQIDAAPGEPFFIMKATVKNLNPQMNAIVNRIVNQFHEAGGPCAITLNEIR